MGSSRVEQALNELDPGSRAVVDLSLGTDFSDENIATLIRVEPDEVARRRERAIDALQQKLGGASHDEVVLELCAAMGVEPSGSMLEGDARNGSNTAIASSNGAASHAEEVEEAEAPESESPGFAADTPVEDFEDSDDADAEAEDDPAPPAVAEVGVDDDPVSPVEGQSATEPEFAATEAADEIAEGEPSDADDDPEADRAGAVTTADPLDAAPEPPEPRRERDAAPPFIPPSSETESHDAADGGSRRRTSAVLAALAAGVIVIGGVVALSGGGGSETGGDEPQTPASESSSGSASSGAETEVSASLEALPEAPAGAEADVTVDGDRLTVGLDGLPEPRGSYEAWLFTSVLDSRPLGSIDSGSGTIRADLPTSAEGFEYLDISVQPSGSPQHSGRSIFRVPVADLLG